MHKFTDRCVQTVQNLKKKTHTQIQKNKRTETKEMKKIMATPKQQMKKATQYNGSPKSTENKRKSNYNYNNNKSDD